MPQSLASVYVHAVFSTKERRPFLRDLGLRESLHGYLGAVSKKLASLVCNFIFSGYQTNVLFTNQQLGLVLVAPFSDLNIRADSEGVERSGAFLSPPGEGLGKQVQVGDEKQDALVLVGGCEAVGDFSFGAGLVGAELFFRPEDGSGAGLVFRPVDLAGFEVVEVDLVNRRRLAVQGVTM